MWRTFIRNFFIKRICFVLLSTMISWPLFAAENKNLRLPIKDLFSHSHHKSAFKKTGISCTNCHSFSIKSNSSDPLALGIPGGLIKPSPQICHECHQGKVQLPRPNQCTLCHSDTKALMPKNHQLNWTHRHGLFAQADSDSCLQCHSQSNCSDCHTQKNKVTPKVHRPNFRSFHSIEARSNPQSCTVCHSSTSSCVNCHTRGFK